MVIIILHLLCFSLKHYIIYFSTHTQAFSCYMSLYREHCDSTHPLSYSSALCSFSHSVNSTLKQPYYYLQERPCFTVATVNQLRGLSSTGILFSHSNEMPCCCMAETWKCGGAQWVAAAPPAVHSVLVHTKRMQGKRQPPGLKSEANAEVP